MEAAQIAIVGGAAEPKAGRQPLVLGTWHRMEHPSTRARMIHNRRWLWRRGLYSRSCSYREYRLSNRNALACRAILGPDRHQPHAAGGGRIRAAGRNDRCIAGGRPQRLDASSRSGYDQRLGHLHDNLAGNVHSHGGDNAAGHVHDHADHDDHDADEAGKTLLWSLAGTSVVIPIIEACVVSFALLDLIRALPQGRLDGVEPDGLSRPPSTPSIA